MADYENINDLLNKVNNSEAEAELGSNSVPEEESLTAEEFVKTIRAIKELQEADKRSVKKVRFNNVDYLPEEGTVAFNQMTEQDIYSVQVVADVDNDLTKVIKTGSPLDVNIRYVALRITTAGDRLNYRTVPGTLTVSRRTDGSAWEQVYEQTNLVSQNENSEEYPVALNLGLWAQEGVQDLRVECKTYYDDENGVRHEVSGNIVYSVNAVNLVVRNLTDWSQRILASDGGFPFSFSIYGAVAKTLHVKVQGKQGAGYWETTVDFAANVQRPESNPYSWSQPEISAYGILAHGVHSVEAWLTCSDGNDDELESDHIINRFMVVNAETQGADMTKAYLMLQQVVGVATNYVRTVIADYAVWVPDTANPLVASAASIPVSIRLTDAGDGDTDYQHEYYRSETQVKAGERYAIDTTIEIENTSDGAAPDTYNAYLRIFRKDEDDDYVNFMYESQKQRFVMFTVDNANDYSPIAGAHFYLNPKVRNNSETDWRTIVNQQTGTTVPSTWINFSGAADGWITAADGVKVLRVPAGSNLTIGYEPWEAFKTNPRASMSLELDFAVRNITAENNPVINISQVVAGTLERLGLRILPLTGALWAQEKQNEEDQDFGFQEDVRTHVVVTLTPALTARSADEFTWQTPSGTEEARATAKVYINAFCNRAVQYSVATEGVWIQGEGHGGIVLGNNDCDLDIYGIRCYRGATLSAQNVLQNYIATRPTADEKNRVREANDILDGNGRVSISKVRGKGKRTLTLHGTDNYKINQDKSTGYACYWDIYYCDDNGSYIPELSGTIGKAAYEAYIAGTLNGKKCLMNTAQGSTANTYWWNNEQTKCDKISYVIRIPFNTLHSDFGWNAGKSTPVNGACDNPMYLNDEQITPTEYNALDDSEKADVEIDVIDGWIDGNGMYHGQFYTSAIGAAKATKLVNKINYASPMQSHKMGSTRLYHDIMMSIQGASMTLQQENPAARFAVLEDSFYFFNQPQGETAPVFVGLSTFGQGKCDKPSWGYNKSQHPLMATFEGSNNNLPMTDFRVPFDSDVTYDDTKDTEGWIYNGSKNFDYDLGATDDGPGEGIPKAAIAAIIKRYINFVYCHDVNFSLYRGTRSSFDTEYAALYDSATSEGATEEDTTTLAEWQNQKWMIRDGSDAFHLIRFNFVTGQWADAGTWNQNTMTYTAGVRNLSTDSMTAQAYQDWLDSEDTGDYNALVERFKTAIALHFSDNYESVGSSKNLKVHYNLVNFLIAGTDNCSKNTYYTIDPETERVFLYQDDMDTIFKTDNNGRQTKVYFLSRYFDKYDTEQGYKLHTDYEGSGNALFNVVERAWEHDDPTALPSVMREILTAMCSLVSSTDTIEGLSQTQKQTPWGCINKYFFNIQRYFPQAAYNEQQRIRYDYPASWGFESYGNQARGILAVTQGIGNQLESEMQYMRRRLALVCSYAAWGDFSAGVNTGSVGLDDTSSAFSLTPGSGRVGGDYTFRVVPHQFLYPCGSKDRTLVNPHVRVAPGESYDLQIAQAGNSVSGDSSIGLAAIHYYRSIGNVGNMVAGNNTITVQGKRLTEFIAEPAEGSTAFRPGNIVVTAQNLKHLSLKGLTTVGGTISLTSLVRAEYIDLRGTSVGTVNLPETASLQTLYLGGNLSSLTLQNLPSLTEFSMDGYSQLTTLSVQRGMSGVDTSEMLSQLYEGKLAQGVAPMQTLRLYDVDATIAGGVLEWMQSIPTLAVTGNVNIFQPQGTLDPAVSFDMKYNMIKAWGRPTDTVSGTDLTSEFELPEGTLAITYRMRSLMGYIDSAVVSGDPYTHNTGVFQYKISQLNPYCNAFVDVHWAMSSNSLQGALATIDAATGELNVTKLSVLSGETTITCTITPSDDDVPMPITKKVGLYDRLAQLGDYVFADGSYSDAEDPDKTVAGICVQVPARKTNGEIDDLLNNPDDKQLRLCVACENITGSGTRRDGTIVSYPNMPWGPYPNANDAANGLFYNNAGTNTLLSNEELGLSTTTFYDLASIENITANYPSGNAWTEGNIKSTETSDGYKYYAPNTMPGFGCGAYGELDGQLNARTLTDSLARLAGETYQAGDIVNGGYANTLKIIYQRNRILGAGIPQLGIQSLAIPQATGNTTELGDLFNGMTLIRDIVKDIQGSDTNTAKWSQIFFPAASACYAYEPNVRSGEVLSPKLKRHNWFLPGTGTLARMNYWQHQGDSSDDNVFKRALADGRFTKFSTSYYWSSVEYITSGAAISSFSNGTLIGSYGRYNSNYVRAVAAF